MNKRNISLIIIGLFLGAAIGGVIGNIFAWMLPDGVVKDFFLTSMTMGIGGMSGNEMGVLVLDLKIITLKFGLALNVNFTSIIGLTSAYYILRYFR